MVTAVKDGTVGSQLILDAIKELKIYFAFKDGMREPVASLSKVFQELELASERVGYIAPHADFSRIVDSISYSHEVCFENDLDLFKQTVIRNHDQKLEQASSESSVLTHLFFKRIKTFNNNYGENQSYEKNEYDGAVLSFKSSDTVYHVRLSKELMNHLKLYTFAFVLNRCTKYGLKPPCSNINDGALTHLSKQHLVEALKVLNEAKVIKTKEGASAFKYDPGQFLLTYDGDNEEVPKTQIPRLTINRNGLVILTNSKIPKL